VSISNLLVLCLSATFVYVLYVQQACVDEQLVVCLLAQQLCLRTTFFVSISNSFVSISNLLVLCLLAMFVCVLYVQLLCVDELSNL